MHYDFNFANSTMCTCTHTHTTDVLVHEWVVGKLSLAVDFPCRMDGLAPSPGIIRIFQDALELLFIWLNRHLSTNKGEQRDEGIGRGETYGAPHCTDCLSFWKDQTGRQGSFHEELGSPGDKELPSWGRATSSTLWCKPLWNSVPWVLWEACCGGCRRQTVGGSPRHVAELCSQAGYRQQQGPWRGFHKKYTQICMCLYQSTLETTLPPKGSENNSGNWKLSNASKGKELARSAVNPTWFIFTGQQGGWNIFTSFIAEKMIGIGRNWR